MTAASARRRGSISTQGRTSAGTAREGSGPHAGRANPPGHARLRVNAPGGAREAAGRCNYIGMRLLWSGLVSCSVVVGGRGRPRGTRKETGLMQMVKKFALIVVVSAFVAGTLGGCGGEKTEPAKPEAPKAPDAPKAPEGK